MKFFNNTGLNTENLQPFQYCTSLQNWNEQGITARSMAALYPKNSAHTKGDIYPKDGLLQRSFHELFRSWINMETVYMKAYMPHSASKATGRLRFSSKQIEVEATY